MSERDLSARLERAIIDVSAAEFLLNREDQVAILRLTCEPVGLAAVGRVPPAVLTPHHSLRFELGSLIKKRRKKMSKHKYRKRQKANRHKKK